MNGMGMVARSERDVAVYVRGELRAKVQILRST